ncbi:hypothetical protein WN55_05496 [Dufourea novaeangliae]|uniref:Uncharacterized protein n=1 Tax=Dufourea novaeangliae TaxID=178035 RepID=A0A154PMH7_DUFNO|nr:hypothetical protein WN55_05496 [Dufourea novaeangliae]
MYSSHTGMGTTPRGKLTSAGSVHAATRQCMYACVNVDLVTVKFSTVSGVARFPARKPTNVD